MITLNEANKYNWKIKYVDFGKDDENDEKVLAIGKVFDFIPKRGEIVVINNKVYNVIGPIYDFDNEVILISLKYAKNVHEDK